MEKQQPKCNKPLFYEHKKCVCLFCCFGCFIIFLIFFFLFVIFFIFWFLLSCCVAKEKYLCDKEICLFAMPCHLFIFFKRKAKKAKEKREKCLWSVCCVCVYVLFFSFLIGAVCAFFCSYYFFSVNGCWGGKAFLWRKTHV